MGHLERKQQFIKVVLEPLWSTKRPQPPHRLRQTKQLLGADSGTTATIQSISKGDIENGFITVSNNILTIVRVFKFGAIVGSKSDGLFDVDYQFALNDLYNLLSADITYYAMTKTHMTTLEQMFRNERQIRWNRKTNKLHIDADLGETYDIDDYVVADFYAILDPPHILRCMMTCS